MNDDFYREAYFFFAIKKKKGIFYKFCERFNLSLSVNNECFEILNYETGVIIHSEQTLEGILFYLDEKIDSRFDFYLEDIFHNSFIFSYRDGGYNVMGIPYNYIDSKTLLNVLVSFDAICGWGWSDGAPQETFLEMNKAANNVNLPFMRYTNGRLIEKIIY